jgi:hypothetical protein
MESDYFEKYGHLLRFSVSLYANNGRRPLNIHRDNSAALAVVIFA